LKSLTIQLITSVQTTNTLERSQQRIALSAAIIPLRKLGQAFITSKASTLWIQSCCANWGAIVGKKAGAVRLHT